MNDSEKTFEEHFADDLDLWLANQPAAQAEDKPYQAELDLARSLSRVRFRPAPLFESRLQSQLRNYLNEREVRTMSPLRKLRSLARPVLVAGLSAAILFAALLVVSPEARAAMQTFVGHFVEVDSPWALLPAAKPPSSPGAEMSGTGKLAPPDAQPKLMSEVVTGTAQLPSPGTPSKPGSEMVTGMAELPVPKTQPTRDLIALKDAQAQVDFKIRMPSKLPSGYEFKGVVPKPELPSSMPGAGQQAPADLPALKPPQSAMLIFANSAGEKLALSERHASELAPLDVPLPAGKGSVQNVTINGQAAQYVEGAWTPNGWDSKGNHQLHWQSAENIEFDLVSQTLGLSDLTAVAESIE